MIRTSLRVQRAAAFAVFAAFTILPSISAMPAAADTPSLMRGTLDEVRREAQSIRIELAQMSPDSAIQLNRRLDELERLIQRLTDKIESLDAQQREFAREFDRFKNDTDFRLEKGTRPPPRPVEPQRRTEAPPAKPPERRAETPPPGRPATPPPQRNRADEDEEEAPPPRPARREEAARPQQPEAPPAGGTARDQYEHALALLRRADYKAAEAALVGFVRRYPNDPLAANAYYWLGENYYAQARYQDA